MRAASGGLDHRSEVEAVDSHTLMRDTSQPITLDLAGKGAAMAMDRVEQAFVATAITGFLVMTGAIVWMMLS
jgi:hypothetical protein